MNDVEKHDCEFNPDQLLLKLDFQLPGDVESIQPSVDEIMEVVGAQSCATGHEFEVEVADPAGSPAIVDSQSGPSILPDPGLYWGCMFIDPESVTPSTCCTWSLPTGTTFAWASATMVRW